MCAAVLCGALAAGGQIRSPLAESRFNRAIDEAKNARASFDYARALKLADEAERSRPGSAEVLIERGRIYLAAEDPDNAKNFFERALRIKPGDHDSIIGLVETYLVGGDYEHAESESRRLLGQNSADASLRSLLARVLLARGEYSKAEDEAAAALAINSMDAQAWWVLGSSKAAERNAEGARNAARHCVAIDPLHYRARRLLSQYLDSRVGLEQRVLFEARTHYEEASALKRAGRLADARGELEQALAIEPRYYRALVGLGDILLRGGDPDRAATAAKMAIELDPEGSIAQLELSYAHRAMDERGRLAIGGVDFADAYYKRTAPPAYALTGVIFPDYRSLTRLHRVVIDEAVAPLARFLPALAKRGTRHYLLAFDQRASDVAAAEVGEQSKDGRYYDSMRGVGGKTAVSGMEYLDIAAEGGGNVIAHEFAHQVHLNALDRRYAETIRRLYDAAIRQGRALDYYAAADEYEYFAQGYEAFVSQSKRPNAIVTASHTRSELAGKDPPLYRFLSALTGGRSGNQDARKTPR
jgi:tetratricopeptide (TPR) repeat protein